MGEEKEQVPSSPVGSTNSTPDQLEANFRQLYGELENALRNGKHSFFSLSIHHHVIRTEISVHSQVLHLSLRPL
jgi:ribosomal protein L1